MKAFVIYCATGCSCCSGTDNHYRGPFASREEADAKVEQYKSQKLVASKFSKTGNYSVEEHDMEMLPDGRIILNGSKVVDGWAADTGDEYLGREMY